MEENYSRVSKKQEEVVKNEQKPIKPKLNLKTGTIENGGDTVEPPISKTPKPWSVKKILLTIIIFLIGFIVFWFGCLIFNFNSATSQNKDFDAKNIGTDSAVTLVLGVDGLSENDLKSKDAQGQLDDRRGIRADSIMLMATNPNKNEVKTLSVYRDLLINDVCNGYQDKLNATFANGWLNSTSKDVKEKIGNGANCMKKSLEQYFGFKINNYIVINFSGFQQIIDAVGGVDIDVIGGRVKGTKFCEQDKFSKNGNPDESSWSTGKYCFVIGTKRHLSGEEALAYARHRHSDDDRWRTLRQAQVMAALTKSMKSPLNVALLPFKTFGIGSAFTTNISGMDISTYLTRNLPGLTSMKVKHIDLPYVDNMINGIYYLNIPQNAKINAANEFNEFIK